MATELGVGAWRMVGSRHHNRGRNRRVGSGAAAAEVRRYSAADGESRSNLRRTREFCISTQISAPARIIGNTNRFMKNILDLDIFQGYRAANASLLSGIIFDAASSPVGAVWQYKIIKDRLYAYIRE